MKIGIKHYEIDKEKLPRSLIRQGLINAIIVLSITLFILFFIPIQDKITGTAIIQLKGKVRAVHSTYQGIINYQVSDGQVVDPGDLLGLIDWDLPLQEIFLYQKVNNFSFDKTRIQHLIQVVDSIKNIQSPISEINGEVYGLSNALQQYQNIVSSSYRTLTSRAMEKEIDQKKRIIEQIVQQQLKINENVKLLKEQSRNDLKLYNTGSISHREYQSRIMELSKSEEQVLAYESQKEMINAEINELLTSKQELIDNTTIQTTSSLNIVLSALDSYQKKFSTLSNEKIIRSPIKGRVSIDSDFLNKRFVQANEHILSLLPISSNQVHGNNYISIAKEKKNKILPGQKVLIKIDQVDVDEYGFIISEVISTSQIEDNKGMYKAYVNIDTDTKSTKGHALPSNHELSGEAAIILSNKSIGQNILTQMMNKKQELIID